MSKRKELRERYLARMTAYNAIRRGKLKPQRCRDCSEFQVIAHHEDYSKPLEIVWLCDPCHRKLHASRVTHCPKGHEYTVENTYVTPLPKQTRHCRQCVRDRARAYQQKLQTKANTLGLSSRKFKQVIAKAEGK